MDYCLFENTANNMHKSIEKIKRLFDNNKELLSFYEIRSLIDILNAAREIKQMELDIEDLYEELLNTQTNG
jgi:thiamine biosynthesis lipoprotein ApbE